MLRFFLLLLLLAARPAFAQTEVREVATRPDVTIRFLYARAENPVASAILFQGGGGNIGIFPNGSMRSEAFLSGGARRFTDNGITVAIVDAPTDRHSLDDFRHTSEHAQDAAAVIAFLRQQSKLPVWAIGTSNGSLSAATAAALLGERGPDGIVLTSSTTRKPVSAAHPVTDAALDKITVPTLFVHHKHDGCMVTPYDAIPGVMASMKKASRIELISVEGGEIRGNPCQSGYHQFYGIEADVTRQIADWIKQQQAGGKVKAGS
jgi:pimeloyl-ACP methyl ester carboxylesterase